VTFQDFPDLKPINGQPLSLQFPAIAAFPAFSAFQSPSLAFAQTCSSLNYSDL
jgi:hypothetical protein